MVGRRKLLKLLKLVSALACLLAASVALSLASVAAARTTICEAGVTPGHCEGSQGVAVDFETGHIYVADQTNNRVEVFDSGGLFLFSFGSAGTGAGQFSGPMRIAVDNDPASTAHHDVYVGSDSFRVQRFGPDGTFKLAFGWGVRNGAAEAQTCGPAASPPSATCAPGLEGSGTGQLKNRLTQDPIAVGPSGVVYVGDASVGEVARIEKFEPNGTYKESVGLPEPSWIETIAIESTGDIYVGYGRLDGVFKYHPNGSAYGIPYPLDTGVHTTAVGVGGEGDLMAAQTVLADKAIAIYRILTLYDPVGNRRGRFAYDEVNSVVGGVAGALPESEGALAAEKGTLGSHEGAGVRRFPLPPPGPIAVPSTIEVPSATVANTKALLSAEIVPEGKATTYRFQYLDRESYEAQGESFEGPGTEEAEGEIGAGEADFGLHTIEALAGCADPTEVPPPADCLKPETEYVFRLIAENADGKGNTPVESDTFEFTTKPPVEIVEIFASGVGPDTARLGVVANPLGIPTTGYFEYVTEAAYEADVKAGGDGFASATQLPDVDGGEIPIDFGSGEEEVARSAVAYPLVPGTAYRYRLLATDPLVEEPISSDETGAFIAFSQPQVESCPANEAFRTGHSAILPDCRAYELVSPLDKSNGDIVALGETLTGKASVLNQSSDSGEKLAYGSYRAFGNTKSSPYTSQYVAQREAGKEWVSTGISPPRGRSVLSPAPQTDTEIKRLSPDLCGLWIQTYAEPPLSSGAVTGNSNLYRQGLCPVGGYEALTTVTPPNASVDEFGKHLELEGVSADGTHAIYMANDNLAAGAPAQPLSCGEHKEEGCRRRLYEQVQGEAQPRYVCILPGGGATSGACTAGSAPSSESKYRRASLDNAISADGQRIFWSAGESEGRIYVRIGGAETRNVSKAAEEAAGSSSSYFWGASEDGSRVFFTTQAAANRRLYEFEVDGEETHLIAGRVAGVAGASEDAKRIYFVSTEDLAAGASEGEPNLYLYEAGEGGASYRFVASIAGEDADLTPGFEGFSAVSQEPLSHAARVSPDGLHAAFVAHTQPTGYDNTDAASPARCEKPGGVCDGEAFVYDATANGGAGKLICASCNPSGGRPAGGSQISVFENDLYQGPRALSEDGKRLYFESDDALVARDTNGHRDVYQWEALGAGGCDLSDYSFSAAAEGCVQLISSGQGNRDSEFVDASPDGHDVFFATLSSLLPQDYGLLDIYDARAGGGLPTPPTPPAPCEGDACQSPASPAVPKTPSSSVFDGPTNPKAKPPGRRCPKGKRAVRKAGKAHCAKRKGARHSKKRAHRQEGRGR